MCYFIPYIELAVTHTSVLTILAITVERYYAICLPLQVGTVFLLCLDSVAIFEGRFSFTVLPAYCDTRYCDKLLIVTLLSDPTSVTISGKHCTWIWLRKPLFLNQSMCIWCQIIAE